MKRWREPVQILLIEDNEGDGRLVSELLRMEGSFGFDMTTVPTLAEATSRIRQGGIDIVLLDLALPDSRGVETLRSVLAENPAMPVVVLTGDEDGRLAMRAVQVGAQDFLLKQSLSGQALTKAIRYSLERAAHALDISRLEHLAAALVEAIASEDVASTILVHSHKAVAWEWGLVLHRTQSAQFELLKAEAVGEEWLAEWVSSGCELPRWLARPASHEKVVFIDRTEVEEAPSDAPWSHGQIAVVPLPSSSGLLGVAIMGCGSAPPITVEDRRFLVSLSHKCGVALERALLLERETAARKEAENAARLRDELLAVVAHDLRNPVSAVSAYAALLEDPDLPAVQRERYTQAIGTTAAQMEVLIRDLLDVGSIERGTLRVEPQRWDPKALVQPALELLEPEARENGLSLSTDFARALPDVRADQGRVVQVLMNLLSNALRFSPGRGEVTLTIRPLGSEVIFLVTDRGRGIPEADLPRLFDRFWRGTGARGSGVGLGLAIAKGIVEALGGRIGVESEVGQGSTFFFTLPLDQLPAGEGATPVEDAEPEEAPEEFAEPLRILLVDDHATVRRGLAGILAQTPNCEVVGEAGSGEEAVRIAERIQPDVVVMDLVMPGIGGVEATRRIASALPDTRVIALTGEAESDALLAVLEAGGSGFVGKATAHHDLVPALHCVARDEVFLYPSGNRLLLEAAQAGPDVEIRDLLETLSENDRKILALAAEGYNSTEIGKQLFLSPKTVDSYRSRAMRRLGLSHRSELIRFALRADLLPTTAEERPELPVPPE